MATMATVDRALAYTSVAVDIGAGTGATGAAGSKEGAGLTLAPNS
jgi:hypothetical protein